MEQWWPVFVFSLVMVDLRNLPKGSFDMGNPVVSYGTPHRYSWYRNGFKNPFVLSPWLSGKSQNLPWHHWTWMLVQSHMKLHFRVVFLWEYLVVASYRGSWPWFAILGLLTQHAETIPEFLGLKCISADTVHRWSWRQSPRDGYCSPGYSGCKTHKQDSDIAEFVGFYL